MRVPPIPHPLLLWAKEREKGRESPSGKKRGRREGMEVLSLSGRKRGNRGGGSFANPPPSPPLGEREGEGEGSVVVLFGLLLTVFFVLNYGNCRLIDGDSFTAFSSVEWRHFVLFSYGFVKRLAIANFFKLLDCNYPRSTWFFSVTFVAIFLVFF